MSIYRWDPFLKFSRWQPGLRTIQEEVRDKENRHLKVPSIVVTDADSIEKIVSPIFEKKINFVENLEVNIETNNYMGNLSYRRR